MKQFTVPQFIDVESKIIGPITARQFIILIIGAVFIGISYSLFDFTLFLTVGVLIFGISGTFAFLKINGRPFHYFVLNLVQTIKRPSLRVWDHKTLKDDHEQKIILPTKEELPQKKEFHSSRLTELSLIVDTKGRYKGEEKREIEIKNI